MNIAEFIESLTTSGRYHFTSNEAVKALNISIVARSCGHSTPPKERGYRDASPRVLRCGAT